MNPGGVSYRRLKATESGRVHSHVCSPHFVSLDFINDVEYYGLRKETSHQQDCCHNYFPIKICAVSTLTQSVAGRCLARSQPGSERRSPQLTQTSLRKLKYRRISHMDHHIKYLCYLPDAHVYETIRNNVSTKGKLQIAGRRLGE